MLNVGSVVKVTSIVLFDVSENIFLFKIIKETVENVVKYVQSIR